MDGLAGPLFIAAALLVAAGVPKVTEPGDTARAMRSVGLPTSELFVRILAVAEVSIGLAVIAIGGPIPSLLLGLIYLGFAGYIILAMSKGGSIASCGCFGKADTPPTYGHLLLNIAAGTVGIIGAIGDPPDAVALLGDQPAFGVPFVAFVLLGAWLGYLTLTLLPQLQTAKRST